MRQLMILALLLLLAGCRTGERLRYGDPENLGWLLSREGGRLWVRDVNGGDTCLTPGPRRRDDIQRLEIGHLYAWFEDDGLTVGWDRKRGRTMAAVQGTNPCRTQLLPTPAASAAPMLRLGEDRILQELAGGDLTLDLILSTIRCILGGSR